MMNKQKVPQLRFSGFDDEWEEKKLGDISNKVTEKNYDRKFDETFTNSAEQGVISQRDYFDHDISSDANIDGYYIVRNNDFVYNPRISTAAPVGPINRNKLGRSGIMSPLYYVFRTKNVDYSFLEKYFKSNCWYDFMFLNGDSGARSDRFSIKDNVFRQMPICMPVALEEQQKIGCFLTKIDSFIQAKTQKLESLKSVKKSLLQKCFPKDGEKVPQMRFEGFSEDWEEKKLGDLGKTFTGLSGKTKEDFGHGKAHYLTYLSVYKSPTSNIEGTDAVEIDTKQNSLKYGDVIFTTSSETPDEVGLSSIWLGTEENVYLNSFCFGFRPSIDIDLLFFAYLLRSDFVREQLILLAQGISRYNISKTRVMEISLLIPKKEEQQKIGQVFLKYDSLISLQQKEIENLKTIKKSLLQKMFV